MNKEKHKSEERNEKGKRRTNKEQKGIYLKTNYRKNIPIYNIANKIKIGPLKITNITANM